MNAKKITLVILHFLGKDLTENCLKSVEKLTHPKLSLEVIVVNNNPQEDLKNLTGKFKKFLFIETGQNLGFAAGNNVGIKKGLKDKSDFILLVNNDTILNEELLVDLVDFADTDQKIGILGPKIYFAPGYEFHKERYQVKNQGKVIWYAGGLIDWPNVASSHRGVDEIDRGQYDASMETDFVSGCAMLVKKEVWEKIGFFDERFFLYWEDVDFCQRAKIAGFKIVFVPQAKLWHANAGSSKVGGTLHDYYMTRNRLLFGLRYASFKTKLALFKQSLKILSQGRLWQKIGVRDFYLRKFDQGSLKP